MCRLGNANESEKDIRETVSILIDAGDGIVCGIQLSFSLSTNWIKSKDTSSSTSHVFQVAEKNQFPIP
jgi:hypothetical protein